jgi:hypothetical protein
MPTQNENTDSDELSISGWVYADLLLALSVLAFGAASFLADDTNLDGANSDLSATTIPNTTIPEVQVANLSCDELVFRFTQSELEDSASSLGERLDRAVRRHAAFNELRDAKVGLMLLFGGYDPESERTSAGKRRADEIEPALRAVSSQLRSVETRTYGASQITQGNTELEVGGSKDFAIVAYLVYDGDPTDSDC